MTTSIIDTIERPTDNRVAIATREPSKGRVAVLTAGLHQIIAHLEQQEQTANV